MSLVAARHHGHGRSEDRSNPWLCGEGVTAVLEVIAIPTCRGAVAEPGLVTAITNPASSTAAAAISNIPEHLLDACGRG
ncbi:MAG: hypothetical protein M3349_04495 [Actinomycetota bacterium]|nr:hypothetical protein [Actinomycetota bacterium]